MTVSRFSRVDSKWLRVLSMATVASSTCDAMMQSSWVVRLRSFLPIRLACTSCSWICQTWISLSPKHGSRSQPPANEEIQACTRRWVYPSVRVSMCSCSVHPCMRACEYSGKKTKQKDRLFGSGDCRVEWGSSTWRGGGWKVRCRPRKIIFLGFRGREPGMSRKLCRDVPDPGEVSKKFV